MTLLRNWILYRYFRDGAIAVMGLWLLCCIVIFGLAQGYDWVSHQSGLTMPTLGLPWLILGGVGLAIASNRPLLKATLPQPTSSATSTTPEPPAPPASTSRAASSPPTAQPPSVPATRKSSISFEIPKKQSTPEP